MHESSLARQVVEVVLARAHAAALARVRTVRGWIAETEALDPESLGLHFASHARGTIAEGARLELELRRVEARCRGCREVFAPERHVIVCPRCGLLSGELLGPTGIGVEELEGE